MSEYRLSGPARRDLETIAAYLADISDALNLRYKERFKRRFELLAAFPMQCQIDERLDGSTRVAIVHPYLILYAATDFGVEISRVVHGARDIPSVLDR